MRISFFCNLVDFVYKNNPMLCTIHIVIGCRKQLGYNALDIVSDIPRFRQRRRVRNGKRYVQKPRKRLYQICFARTGRPNHKHIGFFNFNLILPVAADSLIMVIHRYGHYFFCVFLPDYIIVQLRLDFMRRRDRLNIKYRRRFFLLRLFLFNLLRIRHQILQICEIDHADIRHFSIQILHRPQNIIQPEPRLIHTVKRTLHTILTDADIIRYFDHFACCTLRTMADIADFFIIVMFLIFGRIQVHFSKIMF